ncbi:MAG: GtrA family protein [Casimicrobiaceae bacterium]
MQFARFLVVGTANTAASYGIYLLFLLAVDYRVAYTIAFVAGLAGGYLMHARLVFGARPGAWSAASYLATYAAMYLLSLLVIYIAVDRLSVPKPLGMLAALAFTVPASFILLRRGFRPPSEVERRQ